MKSSTTFSIKKTLEELVRKHLRDSKTPFEKSVYSALYEIESALNEDDRFNGHSNFETWLMSLNLDNDQNLNNTVLTFANARNLDTYEKAECLKQFVEESFYVEEYGIYKIVDIWTDREFKEINWSEIIEGHKDESFESVDGEDLI